MTIPKNEKIEVKLQNRRYFYSSGQLFDIQNVQWFELRNSGNHYLDTSDKRHFIIRPTWDILEIMYINPEDDYTVR